MDVSDLVGAAFLPTDGQANPADIAQSLAKRRATRGVTIVEETRVTGIKIEKGAVASSVTDQGDIACEVVVNCAGQWARQVGALAGVSVPLQSGAASIHRHRSAAGCRRTCRPCAIPIASSISRKRSAGW